MGFSKNSKDKFQNLLLSIYPWKWKFSNSCFFHWIRNKILIRRVVLSKFFNVWIKSYEACSIFGTPVKIFLKFRFFGFLRNQVWNQPSNLTWNRNPGLGLCGQILIRSQSLNIRYHPVISGVHPDVTHLRRIRVFWRMLQVRSQPGPGWIFRCLDIKHFVQRRN